MHCQPPSQPPLSSPERRTQARPKACQPTGSLCPNLWRPCRCSCPSACPAYPCFAPVQLEAVKAALEKAAEGAAFSSAFWALLIVLPAALLVPLALARAYAPGFKGVIVQITALMAGNVVVFGVLAQVLTLRLFWQEVSHASCPVVGCQVVVADITLSTTVAGARPPPRSLFPTPATRQLCPPLSIASWLVQVVLGFVYAGLASALCCLAAGCLVYVQSTHDEVRQSVGAILLDAGSQISRQACWWC